MTVWVITTPGMSEGNGAFGEGAGCMTGVNGGWKIFRMPLRMPFRMFSKNCLTVNGVPVGAAVGVIVIGLVGSSVGVSARVGQGPRQTKGEIVVGIGVVGDAVGDCVGRVIGCTVGV